MTPRQGVEAKEPGLSASVPSSPGGRSRPSSPSYNHQHQQADMQTFEHVNVVSLYKSACQRSHDLSDADLPQDQITPQGFAKAMQDVYRSMPLLPALASVPLISGDALKRAVSERWKHARTRAEATAVTLQHQTKQYDHLLTAVNRVDELCAFPADEYHQAAWILMDMIQADTWKTL